MRAHRQPSDSPEIRARLARRVSGWFVLACALSLACGGGVPQTLPGSRALTANELETYARRHLLDARALRDEGRLESAARVAARGLELQPDNAELQVLRAEILEELGREQEAAAHRRVATLLDPPPPPPPDTPVAWSDEGWAVVLLPPLDDPRLADRVPSRWPDGPVARSLEERVRTRLPDAQVHFAAGDEPASVGHGRTWLAREGRRGAISLRIDRAFCGESVKDGRFAVAWLRVALARPADPPRAPRQVREIVERPPDPAKCRELAVARALERALESEELRELATAEPDPSGGAYSTSAIRSLYPSIGRRIVAEIDAGRAELRLGDLDAALAHFRSATAIDPDDLDALAFLADAEASVSMASQLAAVSTATAVARARRQGGQRPRSAGPPPPEAAAADAVPLFSPEERRRLEARLAEEQRRREEFLAALAVLGDDRDAPDDQQLAAMRPAEIRDPDALGPELARQQAPAGAPLRAAVLYAPDGTQLARFYFAGDDPEPVLREEDSEGDGRPDRWVAYRDSARHRVWEDRQGNGRADLIVTFAADGESIERVEIWPRGDGRERRVFHYADGRLRSEDRDTNGDGRTDLFERFDESGTLTLREQDVNGDGNVDIRTAYSDGRIVRREIVNPEAVTEIQ